MAVYQGLSRIYRPQKFSSVLGQDLVIQTLKNGIQKNRIAQAYLFTGTRGTGKTTLARILAKALNCPNRLEDAEPCTTCSSCIEISEGRNLNVVEIDGASNRGIDDVRRLIEDADYVFHKSGCKIFIIDEVHMLTKDAFNALLKILEEPPPNVKFLFATTEPHKIPATVLSRCQRFDLRRISSSQIFEKLQSIVREQSFKCQDEALYRIAELSDGSLRVAESLLDQVLCSCSELITEKEVSELLFLLPQDSLFTLDEAFSRADTRFAFTWAQEIFSSGRDLGHFFQTLLEHYRTILAAQLGLLDPSTPPSLKTKYENSGKIYSQEQAIYILEYLIKFSTQTAKHTFNKITIEMVLLHILKTKHRATVADLIERLEGIPTQQEHKAEDLIAKLQTPSEKKPELAPIGTRTAREETLLQFAAVELEGKLT